MSSRRLVAAAALSASAILPPASVSAATYVVRPGDSLIDIAVRHATTVEAIARANQLADAVALRPGQMLAIPDSALSLPIYAVGSDDTESHTVAPGEQLFEVARYFGTDPTALARANGIGVNTTLEPGAILGVPGRLGRVNALLSQVAETTGVDPSLVKGVAWAESQWHQDTISATGAVGLMQLEPFAGEWVSQNLAGTRLDVHVARDNVTAGSLLLKHLLTLNEGSTTAALAAYYQGSASLLEHGPFEDTRQYVRVVGRLLDAG